MAAVDGHNPTVQLSPYGHDALLNVQALDGSNAELKRRAIKGN
jgi:hypothetical protein